MSQKNKDLIGVIFGTMDGAQQVLDSMSDISNGAYVHIEDKAVIVRDEDGQIREDNTVSHGTKEATAITGSAGLLLGMLLGGPLVGLAVGVLGGALAGKLGHMGIDPSFIKDVEAQLQPGTSALFILSRSDSRDMIIADMAPYEGTVFTTTLPPEAEAQLRKYLE